MSSSSRQNTNKSGPSASEATSSTGSDPPKRSQEEMQKIFQAFEDYKFTEDTVFNAGLPNVYAAIRGKKMSAGMIDKTIAEAQWFYWTKIHNLPIPFAEYEKHIAQPVVPPLDPAGPSSSSTARDLNAARADDLSEAFRMMEAGGSAGQTHLTFENLRNLILEGKAEQLRGKDIPDGTSNLPPTKSTMQARPKPWRQQEAPPQVSYQPTTGTSALSPVTSLYPQSHAQPQFANQAQASSFASFPSQPQSQPRSSAPFSQQPSLELFTGSNQYASTSQSQTTMYPLRGQGQLPAQFVDPQYGSFPQPPQDLSSYMHIPVFPPELYPTSNAPGPVVTRPSTTGSAGSSTTLLPEMPFSPSYYSPYAADQDISQPSNQQAGPSNSGQSGTNPSSSGFDPTQTALAPSGRPSGQETFGADASGQEAMDLDVNWTDPAWFSQEPTTGASGEETPRPSTGGGPRNGPVGGTAPLGGGASIADQCPPQ
ncbi:hypothetical protein IAU59_002602 [Kwoniella sp. CBS 9459]